jgi:LPPG:FO 2-phospho-L-lactate transferase
MGEIDLTAVVNIADDDFIYGLRISPDLDTVTYTLADVHSESRGWGRDDETWNVMEELGRFPIDSTFRIGDRDLALNLYRTTRLAEGAALSEVTGEIARAFGLRATLLPASDDRVTTQVATDGSWLDFQDYFVRRRHAVAVSDVRFVGIEDAQPAPGVLEAIGESDAVVIGPSNPILSIWPILELPGVRDALTGRRVMVVSPLIAGAALKGPLADLMPAFGFSTDTSGIIDSYSGLVSDVVVHHGDQPQQEVGTRIHVTDTRIADPASATRLASEMITWLA